MNPFSMIKPRWLALVILLSLAATAGAEQTATNQPTGWGAHGMAVFGGREGLYASHLPMFHVPHDRQVIIRFHLSDKDIDARLRKQLAHKPALWTLDPEQFDLLRLAPGHAQPLQRFTARFVQGHFERGGKERFTAQTVIVDEIILFRWLAMATRSHTDGRYHIVGKGRERFLVKEIDRRPDFDLIMALNVDVNLTTSSPATILVPSDDMKVPTLRTLREALSQQARIALKRTQTLYVETDDLR